MFVNLIAALDTFAGHQAVTWQRRFFARRGHTVTLCTPAEAPGLPSADLYIYHYPAAGPLLDTLPILDRGVAVLDCRQLPPNPLADPAFTRLAALSDLIVLPSQAGVAALTGNSAAGQSPPIDPTAMHVVAPAVALTEFNPGPADPDFLRQQGWLDRTLLLAAAPNALLEAALDRVRDQIPHATLAGLPAAADAATRRTFYRHAALYLALPGDPAAPLYALEAMACGTPVIAIMSDPADPLVVSLGMDASASLDDPDDLAARIAGLLTDETRYAAAVQASLARAAAHSQAHYDRQWSAVLAAASVWLPNRVTLPPAAPNPASSVPAAAADSAPAALQPAVWSPGPTLARLKAAAAVTLKDYRVRSAVPYAGSLIVWVRRNLTSHLREPYLDPVLQRQEAFNWQAAQAIEELARQLAALEQAAAETRAETAAFDAELERCLVELTTALDALAGQTDPPDAVWADLRRQLEQARTLLAHRPPPA